MKSKPSYPILRRDHPLSAGLVGAWLATEGSGGKLRNAVGDPRLDANVVNTPEWSAGPQGAVFGGSGTGHASVPYSPSFNVREFTVTILIRRNGNPSNLDTVVAREVSLTPTEVPWRWFFFSGGFLFGYESGGVPTTPIITTGIANTNNQWFLYSGRIIKLGGDYITGIFENGSVLASVTTTRVPPLRESPLFIGAENNRRHFNGQIGGVWFHNIPLAFGDGTIAELHADPFAMFRPRQRSYFGLFADAGPPPSGFKPYWARRTSQVLGGR